MNLAYEALANVPMGEVARTAERIMPKQIYKGEIGSFYGVGIMESHPMPNHLVQDQQFLDDVVSEGREIAPAHPFMETPFHELPGAVHDWLEERGWPTNVQIGIGGLIESALEDMARSLATRMDVHVRRALTNDINIISFGTKWGETPA